MVVETVLCVSSLQCKWFTSHTHSRNVYTPMDTRNTNLQFSEIDMLAVGFKICAVRSHLSESTHRNREFKVHEVSCLEGGFYKFSRHFLKFCVRMK